MRLTLAMFGEAEKGSFHTAYFCQNLADLEHTFGNPPEDSQGLHLAVRAILFERDLIFFRVQEEGFSTEDYLKGFKLLENQTLFNQIDALAMPGVGSKNIMQRAELFCDTHKTLLLINEKDLYDFLTDHHTGD